MSDDAKTRARSAFQQNIQSMRSHLVNKQEKGLRTDFCRWCKPEACFNQVCEHIDSRDADIITNATVRAMLENYRDHVEALFQHHCVFYGSAPDWTPRRFRQRIYGIVDMEADTYNEAAALGRTLSILIFAQVKIDSTTWTKFVENCYEKGQQFVDEEVLPMSHDAARSLFGHEQGPQLCEFQLPFCALLIRKGTQLRVVDEIRRRPYVISKRLGRGAYGVVYAVKVVAGHYRDTMGLTNPGPQEYAVKHIRVDIAKAETEWDVARRFLESKQRHDGITETLASFRFTDYVSLFSERAFMDLDSFMKMRSASARQTVEDRQSIYTKTVDVAGALEFLHSGLTDGKGTKLKCYHLDLKPKNILVTKTGPEPIAVRFKITDFSISAIRVDEEYFNLRKLYKRSSGVQFGGDDFDPCVPPEGVGEHATVDWAADVWSFGAVLSIVLTWIYDGPDANDAFDEERFRDDGQDNFFMSTETKGPVDGVPKSSTVQLKPSVSKWFDSLANGRKPFSRGSLVQDARDIRLYAAAWKVLLQDVFHIKPTARKSMKEVHLSLQRVIYGRAVSVSTSSTHTLSQSLASVDIRKSFPAYDTEDATSSTAVQKGNTRGMEQKWDWKFKEDSLGCQVSPSGTYLMFPFADMIEVYEFSGAKARPRDCHLERQPRCRPPDGYTWVAACLTDNRLYAIAWGASGNLLAQYRIADLKAGPTLTELRPRRHRLKFERIIARSTDEDTLICLAKLQGLEPQISRRVFSINVEQIKRQSHNSISGDDLSSETSSSILMPWISFPWKADALHATREVKDFHLSAADDHVILVQGRLPKGVKAKPEDERISCWDPNTGELKSSIRIEDLGVNDLKGLLFTSLTSLQNPLEDYVLLLRHNKYCHKLKLKSEPALVEEDRKGVRLLPITVYLACIAPTESGANMYLIGKSKTSGKSVGIFRVPNDGRWRFESPVECAITNHIFVDDIAPRRARAVLLPKGSDGARRMLLACNNGKVELLKLT